MAFKRTYVHRIAAGAVALALLALALVPVCTMPSCNDSGCGSIVAPEGARFRSACSHEASPPDDGGSTCDGAVMRHDQPAALASRESGDTRFEASLLAVLPAETSRVQAPRADQPVETGLTPSRPPDPLFGRLVI